MPTKQLFITDLLKTAKNWKQSKYLPKGELKGYCGLLVY